MKKSFLMVLTLVSFGFGTLNAQTDQGTMLVGASSKLGLLGGTDIITLGYTTQKTKSDADNFEESDPDKTIGLNLCPEFGVFVVNNLAIGIDLDIAWSSEKSGDNNSEYKSSIIGAGPFIRYYIPTNSVRPFIETNFSYMSLKIKSKVPNFDEREDKAVITSFGTGAGVAFPIGDRVMFDVVAGYDHRTAKDKEDNEDNYRSVSNILSLKLGFTVSL